MLLSVSILYPLNRSNLCAHLFKNTTIYLCCTMPGGDLRFTSKNKTNKSVYWDNIITNNHSQCLTKKKQDLLQEQTNKQNSLLKQYNDK